MPQDPELLDAVVEKLKSLLPPPIGTQTIPTGIGTKEVLAMQVLLAALKEGNGG